MPNKLRALQDTHQSWWQLATIQLTGMTSLPLISASVLVSLNSTFINALATLILSNIILWIVRYGIISMSFEGRKSTLEVAKEYVGKFGSYFVAVLLLISTLVWFIAQTTFASNALTHLIPAGEETGVNHFIRTSVTLGILSTLFCMEGIIIVRRVALITFPILIIAFIAVIFVSPAKIPMGDFSTITLAGLPLLLGTSLGVTADLPTFFRHSNSWRDSVNGLTAIQLMSLVIGIGGLFFGSIITPWLGVNAETDTSVNLFRFGLIVLIMISAVISNISNVYAASVGWELVAPALAGRKEYLMLGLGFTIVFILVANIFSTSLLLEIFDSSLMNLAIMLVVGYVISCFKQHRPNIYEKTIYFLAWLIATLFSSLQYSKILLPNFAPNVAGSLVVLVVIIFGFSILKLHKIISRKLATS